MYSFLYTVIIRVVGNLLATHPVAFFYYCVIIGGVVWNSLGSGWITTAFRDYNKAFGICYLVCIVLSWISVVLSPTFVFCGRACLTVSLLGGLVYSRKRAIEPPQENGGLLDSILQEEEVMFDIKKVLAEFQREGVSLSVDDILWRDQFSQKEATDKPEFKPLGEDVTPVIVTNIVTNHEDSNSFVDNSILEDLTKELTLQRDDSERDGIVRIASDVLDDEFVNHQQEDAFVREMIQKQQAVIVEEDVGVASSLSGVAGSVTSPPLPIPTELPLQVTPSTSVESSSLGSPIVPNPTPLRNAFPPPTESQPPRPKPKKFSKKKQPKECVVSVDSILSSSRTYSFAIFFHYRTNLPIIQTLPEDSNYSNEYVDLSQQMIQQINDGAFEKKGVNENVNVTYVSLSVFYNTLQIVLSSQTNKSILFPIIWNFNLHLPSPQQRRVQSQKRRYHQGTYGYPCF